MRYFIMWAPLGEVPTAYLNLDGVPELFTTKEQAQVHALRMSDNGAKYKVYGWPFKVGGTA